MWNLLPSKTPEPKNLHFNSRVHVEHPSAAMVFQANLELFLTQLYDQNNPLIILCIGTDRSTGDSLGPLTGTKLAQLPSDLVKVYGTLDNPVHAVNLQETLDVIKSSYVNPFIIAIDACLGKVESVGYVSIKEGPLQPGTGVNKELPAVGNLQIIGIVNVGGFMEYLVLQNTRLNLVMKMADLISDGIAKIISRSSANEVPAANNTALANPAHC